MFLVNVLKKVRPIGQNVRAIVTEEYNQEASRGTNTWIECNDDAIKQWYGKIIRVKKPTGDSDCPYAVRECKRIKRMIEERVHMDYVGALGNDMAP